MVEFVAILPAAGVSSRFGGGRNKLLEELAGKSVILRSLLAFVRRPDVRRVIVPTAMDDLPGLSPAQRAKVCLCRGGDCRQASVRAALEHVPADIQWVAVHDAARPLISQTLIDQTLAAAVEHGAAAPALPVSLTIKQAAGPLPALVQRTLPRQTLFAMQTPQIMQRHHLQQALATCPLPLDQVTDDAQLLELAGLPVWLISGQERNLKITTQLDMRLAREIVQEE